ncbi:MAG: bifunctional 4-hydroxy-3-methylbut-2-enyl diphosphate reductase/30S ribosomal protein S1 [Eubacteriales bacterium]
MKIIRAKTAGFCFGVNQAVTKAYENINKKNIYTLGAIIHNQQVVNDLAKKGIKVINFDKDIHTIEEGTIIIRSHGIGKKVYDKLKEKNFELIDTTCPYVKRIHKIVREKSKQGYKIIVIGNDNHPEVLGIVGWSVSKPIIIDTIEKAKKAEINSDNKVCIVSQTTFNINKFEEIVEIIKKKVYDVIVFNTICSATLERQNEAAQIAKIADKMIVIGGKHSSNTRKLYEICKKECLETYHIETLNDIDTTIFNYNDTIGITAGASTPNNIIEEVFSTMSLENESFEQLLEDSLISIHPGKVVKGTILEVKPEEVILNFGYKSDGIITKKEFTNYPNVDLKTLVNVGDEIKAKVIKVNDGEGQVLLTYKRLAAEEGYQRLQEAFKNKEVLKEKVAEVLSSGLVVIVDEARVFIPASLVSDQYVEDLKDYQNKEIEFMIIEFNPRRRRIIGSRKELIKLEKEKQEKDLFDKIEVGMVINGRVKNVTDFGAFIDLDGADGLLHISEMSWGRIKNPSSVLKVNENIDVLVKEVDKDNKKIALSLKFEGQNPWNNATEKFAIGNVVTGKVARMTNFGAFIELEPGIDALLHVSQISKKHVDKPSDELKIGDEITAKIVDFKEEEKKISLSIKALEAENTDEESESEDIQKDIQTSSVDDNNLELDD